MTPRCPGTPPEPRLNIWFLVVALAALAGAGFACWMIYLLVMHFTRGGGVMTPEPGQAEAAGQVPVRFPGGEAAEWLAAHPPQPKGELLTAHQERHPSREVGLITEDERDRDEDGCECGSPSCRRSAPYADGEL